MSDDFARSLDEWTAFYALMGGAAATLLGLLFVAASLRLNIFHDDAVADVRAFAGFSFGSFLMGVAVPALALAPHEQRASLAAALVLAAGAGLMGVARIYRLWLSLSPLTNPSYAARYLWQGRLIGVSLAAPYVGLGVAAGLLWIRHPFALGLLAAAEGLLLGLGTASAWLLLSHAGAASDGR